jgi:methyltransferase-like protein
MVSTNFAPEIAKTLNEIGAHDILQMEKYMDFVRCRYFRQTLLCHSAVRLNRRIGPETLKGLHLSSQAAPDTAEPELDRSKTETFRTGRGRAVKCRSPLTKLALMALRREWPMPVAFDDLYTQVKAEAAKHGQTTDNESGENFFGGEMLTCMAAGVVEWRLAPPPFTAIVGRTPATTAAARLQATQGLSVSNLRGETVTLDELHRQLLMQLDGTRNLAQLTDALMSFVQKGGHTLTREGSQAPVTDEKEMRGLLASALEKALQNLAKKALLLVETEKPATKERKRS